jgi:hypothetical protein
MNTLNKYWLTLPPWLSPWLARALSLASGMMVALVLYYVLYRMGLPSKPFIYVAF